MSFAAQDPNFLLYMFSDDSLVQAGIGITMAEVTKTVHPGERGQLAV